MSAETGLWTDLEVVKPDKLWSDAKKMYETEMSVAPTTKAVEGNWKELVLAPPAKGPGGEGSYWWDTATGATQWTKPGGVAADAAPEGTPPPPPPPAPTALPPDTVAPPVGEQTKSSPEIAPEPQTEALFDQLAASEKRESFKAAKKKRMSVHRIKTRDVLALEDDPNSPVASGSGLSYAVTEIDERGLQSRKSMKIIDGVAAEALAQVLGIDIEELNNLTEKEIEEVGENSSHAIVAVPEDLDMVFELAAKMGVAEVRVGESSVDESGRANRISFFQKASVYEDDEDLDNIGDDVLQLDDSPAKSNQVIAVTQGSAHTTTYHEGNVDITERVEQEKKQLVDSNLEIVGVAETDTQLTKRVDKDLMLTTSTMDTTYLTEKDGQITSGVTERTMVQDDLLHVTTGTEKIDELHVDIYTGDRTILQSDKVNMYDEAMKTYDEHKTDIITTADQTVRLESDIRADKDLGVVNAENTQSYEVYDNKDGELVQTGTATKVVTTDELTKTTTVSVTQMHDEEGVVSQQTANVTQAEVDGIVYSTTTAEYLVNDKDDVLATGSQVMTSAVDLATGAEVKTMSAVTDADGIVTEVVGQSDTILDAAGVRDTVQQTSTTVSDPFGVWYSSFATANVVEDSFAGVTTIAADKVEIQDGVVKQATSSTMAVATEAGYTAITDATMTKHDEFGLIQESKVQMESSGDQYGDITTTTALTAGPAGMETTSRTEVTSHVLGLTDIAEDRHVLTDGPEGVTYQQIQYDGSVNNQTGETDGYLTVAPKEIVAPAALLDSETANMPSLPDSPARTAPQRPENPTPLHAGNASATDAGYLHQGSQAYARRQADGYASKAPEDMPTHPPPSPHHGWPQSSEPKPSPPPDFMSPVKPSAPPDRPPEYRRPAPQPLRWEEGDYAPDHVPGALFSASKVLELDGDLGPLGGWYARCGVVNGCTAWVNSRDPSTHLFWEEGAFGPCWTVAQNARAPGVGGFRRLLLPSERSSSPPPERSWLRIGEPVGVSVRRPQVQ